MAILWGRSKKYRYRAHGRFYCPGCRQTVTCLHMEIVRVSRFLIFPLFRSAGDAGLVKCPLCDGVFDRGVTAFSPEASKKGLEPALLTVLLLMMEASDGDRCVESAVVSRILTEVTGEGMDPSEMAKEIRVLLERQDPLGDALSPIALYLTNGDKRLVLESALCVAHSDGYASEKEMALMRQIAGELGVSESVYERITDGCAMG